MDPPLRKRWSVAVKLRLSQVKVVKNGVYEAIFQDEAGLPTQVTFTIDSGRGVDVVVPDVDVFMDGRADARAVAGVILAFHRAVGVGGGWC